MLFVPETGGGGGTFCIGGGGGKGGAGGGPGGAGGGPVIPRKPAVVVFAGSVLARACNCEFVVLAWYW